MHEPTVGDEGGVRGERDVRQPLLAEAEGALFYVCIIATLGVPHVGKVLQVALVGKDVKETQELPANLIRFRQMWYPACWHMPRGNVPPWCALWSRGTC